MNDDLVWNIRAFVYRQFAGTAHPPSVEETASHFGLVPREAAEAYEELEKRHVLLLTPGTHDIRMAWPFSGVETLFKVHVDQMVYSANCAWDSFGIPAALHTDAEIEAVDAQSEAPVHFSIASGQIRGPEALAHFLVPFRDWYNDLPFT